MRRHDRHTDSIDQAFDRLLEVAVAQYAEKQRAMERRLAPFSRWQLDLTACTLHFSGDGRDPEILAVTPIATYIPASNNWLWGWANEQVPEAARQKSSRLKLLTGKTQYRIFETASFNVTAEEIDELCALALKELTGQAVFKAKDSAPWLFLVIE
jgi:hypothetical protein